MVGWKSCLTMVFPPGLTKDTRNLWRLCSALIIALVLAMPLPGGNAGASVAAPEHEGDPVPLDPAWEDRPNFEDGPMEYSYVGNPLVVMEVSYRPNHLAARVEGRIILELFHNFAPLTTEHIVGLVQSGFYNGTIFHRVIDDFVVQGGDPDANDPLVDGSGTTIPLEINKNLSHKDGAMGMARESGDPDSADSQWYITDKAQHGLDDWNRSGSLYEPIDDRGYAVFGVVRDGMRHVRALACVPTSRHPAGCENPGTPYAVDDRPLVDADLVGFYVADHVRPPPTIQDHELPVMLIVAASMVILGLIVAVVIITTPTLARRFFRRGPPRAGEAPPMTAEEPVLPAEEVEPPAEKQWDET